MFLIFDKCFAAELLSRQSKGSESQISCFSSKRTPALSKKKTVDCELRYLENRKTEKIVECPFNRILQLEVGQKCLPSSK